MSFSASPIPNAKKIFLDANGAPLAGGSVGYYVPGTLVAKTTWLDENQATPNPTIITLDSAGRAIVFGSGDYREILKDINGNTIWDAVTNVPQISNAVVGTQIITSGNIVTGAWGTNGIREELNSAVYTDTTSNGTVAATYIDVHKAPSVAASNATTYTNVYTLYAESPSAAANATITNAWAFGADNANITGTLKTALLNATAFSSFPTALGYQLGSSSTVATTIALPANTYNNGAAGVGATLTGNVNGALTVDGYNVATGDSVLVKNEITSVNNGIYKVTQTGNGGSPYILTRARWFDNNTDAITALYPVAEFGTTNANTRWLFTNPGAIVFGITAITFTQWAPTTLNYVDGSGNLAAVGFNYDGDGVARWGGRLNISGPLADWCLNLECAGQSSVLTGIQQTGMRIDVQNGLSTDIPLKIYDHALAAVLLQASGNGLLGIGMVPVNVLDITQNQNAHSIVNLLNNNAGAAAFTEFQASNGTHVVQLAMFGTGWTTNGLNIQDGAQLSTSGAGGLVIETSVAAPVIFGISATEEWRIDTNGFLLGGFTSSQATGWKLQVSANNGGTGGAIFATGPGATNGTIQAAQTSATAGQFVFYSYAASASGTYNHVYFSDAGTSHGSITSNGSNVAYNTTSDERLKDWKVEQIDYRSAINELWVGNFVWKKLARPGFGIRAQQAYEVLPNHIGVTPPDGEDGVWSASAEPFGLLALWGVKDLYGEVKRLRSELDAIQARN